MSEDVLVDAMIIRETAKAYQIAQVDDATGEVEAQHWIAKSQIRNLEEVTDLYDQDAENISIKLPEWLAKKCKALVYSPA